MTPPLTTYSFTFSEEIEINVSDPTTWINENIILTETINFFPVVNFANRKFELSADPALDNLLTYTIAFGAGIKAKTGKTLSPNTKVTFTCSGCMPL
ncbi:Ig-like domain-containing protein [Leptospira bandrabouensis]|uniref:Ig-like domain-containing protein n=1 Tax=Leptospira bandrabouensis TaxID=2484903 RepID=UPI00223E8CB2|nr:Ig-like domain-containing protein [Leptospira bandrabouensis]MCW7456847.1 Ig-like domain-containing protein [Leptospira bandrabouensis]MCW7475793.1 Ig-like domain-containing protein [Leptospira bandrabouensis]MCW7483475.1 Ig-like domain-containing protein [Leptospira bandrabouensis]